MKKDFKNVRERKLRMLSKIDKLQSEIEVLYSLNNVDENKITEIENALDYLFDKMFFMIDCFEQQYKVSYNELETELILN